MTSPWRYLKLARHGLLKRNIYSQIRSGDHLGQYAATSGKHGQSAQQPYSIFDQDEFLRKVSLSELVLKVSRYLDADKDEVLSGNRRVKNCHACDLISFVAAKSMGYKFNDISETLGIHPVTAGR